MGMDEPVKDPLLEALPPATDYITYLTILEYNLNPKNISTLENILEDAELTANIGWDLVHLLLPLLPASEKCLITIAHLGNPREVVLKVTECLRLLDFDHENGSSEEEDNTEDPRLPSASKDNESDHIGQPGSQNKILETLQFNILLSMLSILHPRIKTKTPSRFLATSLEAIVATESRAEVFAEALTPTILLFVENLTRLKGPTLPNRRNIANGDEEQPSKPNINQAEDDVQNRLVQAFLTHVLEIYMRSLNAPGDVPGLAWAARVYEKLYPKRQIPGRETYQHMFESIEVLKVRDSTVKHFMTLAKSHRLEISDLLQSIFQTGQPSPTEDEAEDDLPDTADDIPLSTGGSLLLLAAWSSSAILEGDIELLPKFNIFPEHACIVDTFLGENATCSISVGSSDTEALLDSILVLGLQAFDHGRIGLPQDDDAFNRYLQVLSILSADSQSPRLRYQAHNLVTCILYKHPNENVRLYFIRDTLEHCPYENLKVSAVGWLKDETAKACSREGRFEEEQLSLFATPVPLNTTAAFLFPKLTSAILSPDDLDLWTEFKANLGFHMSVLNFYYLLLTAPDMRTPLDIEQFHTDNDVNGRFLQPLRTSCKVLESLTQESLIAQMEGLEGLRMVQMDLFLLIDALERVSTATKSS